MVGIGKLGVVFHSLRITQQRLRPKLPILPRLLLDFRSKNQLLFPGGKGLVFLPIAATIKLF